MPQSIDYEDNLRKFFKLLRSEGADVLKHLGLPADVTWKQFRKRYSGEPLSTLVQVHAEAMRHEHFAAKSREAAALIGLNRDVFLNELTNDIEMCQRRVMEHGRLEDRQALADLLALYRELTETWKAAKH